MGNGVHHPRRAMQLQQQLVEMDRAEIFGQRPRVRLQRLNKAKRNADERNDQSQDKWLSQHDELL
jgi:hypothetical protein